MPLMCIGVNSNIVQILRGSTHGTGLQFNGRLDAFVP
jgi:hypothetical protein